MLVILSAGIWECNNNTHTIQLSLAYYDELTPLTPQYTKLFHSRLHGVYLKEIISQAVTQLNNYEFRQKKTLTSDKLLRYYQQWLTRVDRLSSVTELNLNNFYSTRTTLWRDFYAYLIEKEPELTSCKEVSADAS